MNVWLTILVAILGSTVVTTIVDAFIKRRNMGAEAERVDADTERIATETARGMLAEMRIERDDLRREMAELKAQASKDRLANAEESARRSTENRHLRGQVTALLLAAEEQRQYSRRHDEWDRLAIRTVNQAVPPLHLPEPPPLTPPEIGSEEGS